MLPHLTSGSPAYQRAHQHYSASCPLDCPARRNPHQSLHYPSHNSTRYTSAARHPHLDPSVLHPAFSGLFFQQRRSHVTQSFPQGLPVPPLALANVPISSPLPSSSSSPSPLQPQSLTLQRNTFATAAEPVLMDPARVSPIFFGYSPNPDKAKM
ncbi:hypothetical protein BC939DRAFT_444617 [Gamsiella multidivaricata]|uniref:uncharacterized protein n=1 Tax=Gamsiella multidivaricata TaxID=101098 RepID=UPI00221E4A7B|nr:uncharacterized protein BC939DRAFT_444617 [Gamsiella multidivaricata]KAI7827551.1 hypothetical protein BC939DRAFT_444617 [Gamsiella multidivaricata]